MQGGFEDDRRRAGFIEQTGASIVGGRGDKLFIQGYGQGGVAAESGEVFPLSGGDGLFDEVGSRLGEGFEFSHGFAGTKGAVGIDS